MTTEILTWPERVLREVPDRLLERTDGHPAEERVRARHLHTFCKARGAVPTLLEVENERKRRREVQQEAS